MSTVHSTISHPLSLGSAAPASGAYRMPQRRGGARGLTALLLAAAVASLVVVADRLISTWADGHLLLAWVILWAVVFAGMALFADVARRAARAMLVQLDRWSKARAENRADARLWAMAKQDPRLMSDLLVARQRAETDSFEAALAPMGIDAQVSKPAAPATLLTAKAVERLARRAIARGMY